MFWVPALVPQATKDAEKEVKEVGIAECVFCKLEIRYHPGMSSAGWTWESEEMIGWCDSKAPGNKHSPKLT